MGSSHFVEVNFFMGSRELGIKLLKELLVLDCALV